ncbi:MAG TPA: hypothetical protein ENI33_00555 [Thermoplasmatales archaeon]|nr:hypothetical protein [Thermoplasmatales archaeon]
MLMINFFIINDKLLYYYRDIDEATKVPLNAGEVILANCSHFIIQNLNIMDGDVGILLGFSSYNDISYNNIANVIAGIWLTHSSYNAISNNIISNVGGGIPMTTSSNHNIISENIIADNWEYGIGLWASSYNTISDNTITNNQQAGIYLMIFSNLNTISKNVITNNWYGVYLSSSFISITRNNNFIGNHKHAFFENSIANFWLRNYWDDHIKFSPKVIDGTITLPWNPSKTIDWKNFDWLPAHEPYEW